MLKILFIGDINGRIAREAIRKLLPKLKTEFKPDLIIGNIENAAHGKGVTMSALQELLDSGIDFFTNGDHAFDKGLNQVYDQDLPIIRPANYSTDAIGQGYAIIEKKQHKILVINLIGRVFMPMDYDCPFRKIDQILAEVRLSEQNLSAIIVDNHAEATSEKIAMGHYLDGRVSAVFGTHTHIMTADAQIMSKGTAYITDVGMVGFSDGVIGLEKDNIVKTFLTQIKYPHIIPEVGKAILNAILVEIDPKTQKAISIQPITKHINIKN